jgi:SAM-dependent methyltransferase
MATDGLPAGLPFSPAAERNRGPILAVLAGWLPAGAAVLEVASGTGQHAAHCAAAMPGWLWQPTEAGVAALPAIAARCASLPNVLAPCVLDVMAGPWPSRAGAWDAVFCANLVHIAPWPVTAALLRGAALSLAPGGQLVLYGPYIVDGEPLAPGNLAFDADLRARNPAWGLRRLADLDQLAAAAGLKRVARADMPANNLMLRWQSV